jgi:DNA-directed RNA polymerase subunit alpha
MTKKDIWDVYGKIRKMDNKNTIPDDILNFMTNTAIKKLNENKDKDEIFNTSIEELDFTVRTSNCLRSVKIDLVSDLVNCTKKDILNIRWMGILSLREIEQTLTSMGLSLKES